VADDPLAAVRAWHEEAVAAGVPEPDAAALATVSEDGRPSVRFVLLKGIDERGVRFFTNYASRKARELEVGGRGALAAWWHALNRQVRLEGPVERLSAEESDAYFMTRARGARLGAWVSRQSAPLPDRDTLNAQMRELDERFGPAGPPRPEWWGGYLLRPDSIELWSGRPDRLHDRVLFTRRPDGEWDVGRLYP
jgi:pyridoxamine 5'-phosphate oxidase